MQLLGPADPDPVFVRKGGADALFVIICDHAGRGVPERMGDLGLPPAAFEGHIAWDIGALDLSLRLGRALGAPVIAQRYSRLVIDCNRAPGRADAIPKVSDGQAVPGNLRLDPGEAAARVAEIHAPYHAAIARELDARAARGAPSLLVFVHSFTPRLEGFDRPWSLGVLHHGGSAFSTAVLAELRARPAWVTGDNQPYALNDVDFSAPLHALRRGLDYLELEVRQDLLASPAGLDTVATLLTDVLPRAADRRTGRGP